MVQWLELCAFTAKGWDSVPGRRTKILQVKGFDQKKKKKKSNRICGKCVGFNRA